MFPTFLEDHPTRFLYLSTPAAHLVSGKILGSAIEYTSIIECSLRSISICESVHIIDVDGEGGSRGIVIMTEIHFATAQNTTTRLDYGNCGSIDYAEPAALYRPKDY